MLVRTAFTKLRGRECALASLALAAGCQGGPADATASDSQASTSAPATTDATTTTTTPTTTDADPTTGTGTGGQSTTDATTSTGSTTDITTGDDTGGIELGPVVLRINVGGPAIADFLADDGPESPYRAGPDTQTYTVDGVAPDASVPPELPLDVLATGRVEPPELAGGTGQLHYAIPVEPGPYQLRLHFAGPSQGAGSRLVELRVDDATVVDALDISALTADNAGATVTVAIDADDWLDLELVRKPGSAMPLLSAIELFGAGGLRDAPAGVVRHITPQGGGSGASLADAAALTDLPALVAASAPGDEVWIHAGDYMTAGELVLSTGGAPGAPVVIRGVGDDWHDAGRPRFVGTRADPWDPAGAVGGTVFRLNSGADHLRFVNLGFANQGNGCWRVAQPLTDLRIENVVAANVHRLLEDYVGGDGTDASITGLRLKDVSVRGYARAVARLQYQSAGALLEDVFGDSEAQQYEDFSTGVTLYEFAHDIVIRRAVMLNHQQLGGAGYWNADGFSSERDNYGLLFEDTFAAGNTDGGYDLKSTATILRRATAVDNKRNFRLWGEVTLTGCVGLDPHLRGGSGTQAQLHGNPQGQIVVEDGRFVDGDAKTIVFDIDGDAAAKVVGGCVERHPDATYQAVEPTASLTLEDVAEVCR
jgi:hypothetical protein